MSATDTLVSYSDRWYAADVEMGEVEAYIGGEATNVLPENAAMRSPSISKLETARFARKVYFQQNTRRTPSNASIVPTDAVKIEDLCAALKQYEGSAQDQPIEGHLGYLPGDEDLCHRIYHSHGCKPSSAEIRDYHGSRASQPAAPLELAGYQTPAKIGDCSSHGQGGAPTI